MKLLLVGCVVFFVVVDAAHLPAYLKACRKSDPIGFDSCAKKHATDALNIIVKGDKKFDIPLLSPLKLPLIDIDASNDLNIKLSDSILHGLEITTIEDMKFDFDKQHIAVEIFSKRFNLQGHYNIKGKILILPIVGEGPANITLEDGRFTYSFDYKLVNKNGKEYMNMYKHQITYESGRSYYQFDNLFNGDKALGDQMNKFLNENWKDVAKDLNPSVSQTVDAIVTQILNGYFSKVPFNELVLP